MTALLFVVAVVAALRGTWSPCGLSMLSSLNAMAERARGHRFWVTACWYVGGAVIGGALLGGACALGAALAGLAGPEPAAGRWVVLVAALVAVASDLRLGGRHLPDNPRQVDERWLTAYRRWIYAGGYGVQIGAGFATYIMTAATYLLAVLAVAGGRPDAALAAGLVFGLVRGCAVIVAGYGRDPERLRRLMAFFDAATPWSIAAAVLASAAVAVATAAMLGGWPLSAAVAVATGAVAVSRPVAASRPVASSRPKTPRAEPRGHRSGDPGQQRSHAGREAGVAAGR